MAQDMMLALSNRWKSLPLLTVELLCLGSIEEEEEEEEPGRTLSPLCHLVSGHSTLNTLSLRSEQLAITMDINSKSEFIYFMQRACEDQSNDCYIELYNILLRFCSLKKIAFLVQNKMFFVKKKNK